MSRSWAWGDCLMCDLLCGPGFAGRGRWSLPLFNFHIVLWFHDAPSQRKKNANGFASDAWNPALWGQHLCMLGLPQPLFRLAHLNCVPKPAPRSGAHSLEYYHPTTCVAKSEFPSFWRFSCEFWDSCALDLGSVNLLAHCLTITNTSPCKLSCLL